MAKRGNCGVSPFVLKLRTGSDLKMISGTVLNFGVITYKPQLLHHFVPTFALVSSVV
jgi:hypothetical protein